MMESFFSKVTEEISAFQNSVAKAVTQIVMFRNVALLEIPRNSFLTSVTGLQAATLPGCNATKNELVTKFCKGVLKILENGKEKLCYGVSLYLIASLSLQLIASLELTAFSLTLNVFKMLRSY